MAFPEQPILDTCVRANEGPPPSASWTTGVDSDHAGMKILSNKMAPNGTGSSSAMWNTLFPAPMECFAQVDAFPPGSGQGSMELYLCIQNGDTATPSGYILRFWHSGTGGVGALELDRHDAGSNTRLHDEAATLTLGQTIGFWNNNGTLRVYVNGVEKTGFAEVDTAYTSLAGRIGIGTLNDNVLTTRYSNFGGGAVLTPGTPGMFAEIVPRSWF